MLIMLMPCEIKQSTTISSEKQHNCTNGKVNSIHLNASDCEYRRINLMIFFIKHKQQSSTTQPNKISRPYRQLTPEPSIVESIPNW